MSEPTSARRMLTDQQIEALPEGIRDHYRTHDWLRDRDDLAHFPAGVREVFERLAARSAAQIVQRIRDQEGDAAADAAARSVTDLARPPGGQPG